MPLFGKSSKSPVELVRVLKESLLVLEKGGEGRRQARKFPLFYKVCSGGHVRLVLHNCSKVL